MTTPDTPRPISVHVASSAPSALGAPARRKLRNAVTLSYSLTSAHPIHHMLPYDTNRLYALVQVGGNNVVLCTDLSQAQDPANQAAGVPYPNGFLLTAGNTMPVKIEGCQNMWVVANTFPSQVTWIAIHEQAT
jgi:hypothetical protein